MNIEHDRGSYLGVARILLIVNPATHSLIPYPAPEVTDSAEFAVNALADWIQNEAEKGIRENTRNEFCEAGYWSTMGVHLSFGHTSGKRHLPVYAKATLGVAVLAETYDFLTKPRKVN